MAREITYNNFEIYVVFMPNITTNHAITPTYMLFVRNYHADFTVQCL